MKHRVNVWVVRHGERLDLVDTKESRQWKATSRRPFDPPLTPRGLVQAEETGKYLQKVLSSQEPLETAFSIGALDSAASNDDPVATKKAPPRVLFYASPLVRTVETALGIQKAFPDALVNIEPGLCERVVPQFGFTGQPAFGEMFNKFKDRLDMTYTPVVTNPPSPPERWDSMCQRYEHVCQRIGNAMVERERERIRSHSSAATAANGTAVPEQEGDGEGDLHLILVTHGYGCMFAPVGLIGEPIPADQIPPPVDHMPTYCCLTLIQSRTLEEGNPTDALTSSSPWAPVTWWSDAHLVGANLHEGYGCAVDYSQAMHNSPIPHADDDVFTSPYVEEERKFRKPNVNVTTPKLKNENGAKKLAHL